jgi:CRISPR-associated endonuclease Csn1
LKSKKYPADEYKDGKYWAKIKLSAKPAGIFSVFADKPEKGEGEIIIKGDVKGGTYSNENLGNLPAKLDEGKYWYKAKIKNINYIKPEKKQPSKTKNQLLVYGESIAALFHSYLFDSVCDKGDGEYWALVDLDIETGEFFKIRNQTPTITEKQIIVEGNIDNAGTFSTDMDRNFTFQSAEKHGKYWAVFDNETEKPEYYTVENKITAEKDQKTVEGSVWVDKYTAEIKFDPKKNRDDHRHHAIDAMAIALSKQSHVQHLSNYYENEDEKERNNLHDKIQFPEPWENFRHDAEKMASQILISYKINKNKRKALVKISKTIVKNGKKYISKGNAVRSFLHKDNVYGQRQAPNAEKAFHIRKDVKSLKDATQYEKIVDKTIKEIVIRSKAEEERINKELDKLKKQLLKAKDTEEQSILEKINELTKERSLLYTLPNKNGGDPVPIKKVRIKENFGNAQVLKQKEIVKEKTGEIVGLNQHVNPRNNHHVAIYKREDGALFEKIVTFWEAAERKKQGLPVVDNSPTDGSVFVTSLIENDMFILGLTPEQINWTEPNYHLLNTHLYRVQKISFGDYSFRHHLASTLDNPKEEIRIASYSAWKKINPIKVKIDILGNISKAE